MNKDNVIIVIFMLGLILASLWFLVGQQPTKLNVDNFFAVNSYNPPVLTTDYGEEYYYANYLRMHTALITGQIFYVPKFTFLFVFTPFHYFNYIEPSTNNLHTYVFVLTSDEGVLVYNPVTGDYVGKPDDLS